MNKNVRFILALIRRFKEDEVSILSSQLAYSLLLSSIPFLIFLLTLVGYTPISSNEVIDYLKGIMPREALELLDKTVAEVVDVKNGNLLSFSLIATIWAATGGIKAVMRCLNKAYDEVESRGFIKVQLLSIVFTVGMVLVMFFTIILLVFGNVIGDYLVNRFGFEMAFKYSWNMLRFLIMVFVMIVIFVAVYYFLPSRRLKCKEVIPGALFSAGGWIISSIAFSYYVDNFANYSRLYGGIAAVFILMAWIYLSSMILMIGGEINAALALDMKNK